MFDQKKLQRYYDMKRASNLLGLQMLMARRMCEAGCGFVTVSDCGWDYHANNNGQKYMTGVYPMGNQWIMRERVHRGRASAWAQ